MTEPVPPPPVTKDECYPLLSVIQWLMLWAQKQGLPVTMQMANSYEWPPVDPPEGHAVDIKTYYSTFILSFERALDWNQMAQLDGKALDGIAQSIVDYIHAMKPATGDR
jgi:hypothetical protein